MRSTTSLNTHTHTQARKVEYKDPMVEQWEKFKKSIQKEDEVSLECCGSFNKLVFPPPSLSPSPSPPPLPSPLSSPTLPALSSTRYQKPC